MIKFLIFDLDGTLYPEKSALTLALRKKTKLWISKSLKKSLFEVESLYKKLPSKYPNPLNGFSSLGLSLLDYHKNVFNTINVSKLLKKDFKLISLFKSIPLPKVVATFSSVVYSKRVLIKLGLLKQINKIYSIGSVLPRTDKYFLYENIRKEYHLLPSEILIIGNSFTNDLAFSLKKGYRGILIASNNFKYKNLKCIREIYSLNKLLLNSNI
jgi:FMN phosphatase YigB (HAD superfamily)